MTKKNYRREQKKKKGERPKECKCTCHWAYPEKIHEEPCCYPKDTGWIMCHDDNGGPFWFELVKFS